MVTFNITAKDGSPVVMDDLEHAPVFSDIAHHGDQGPAIKHTLGFTTTAKYVQVTVQVEGYDHLQAPYRLKPLSFEGRISDGTLVASDDWLKKSFKPL